MAPAPRFESLSASALLAAQVGRAPALHEDAWSEHSAAEDEATPSSEACCELSRLDLPSSRTERLRRSRGRNEPGNRSGVGAIAARRRRVDDRLLRVEIPDIGEQLEAEEALAAIAAAASVPPSSPAEKQLSLGIQLAWGPRAREWDDFLESIRFRHEWRILKALGGHVDIAPVYPEEHVQKRFLKNLREVPSSITLGFHGSKKANFESIARRGLIVPGHSGIEVANGQVHGKGIYIAAMDAPYLSLGFSSDSKSIFVCAVCDTSVPVDEAPVDECCKQNISSTHVMSFLARKKQQKLTNWSFLRLKVKAVSDDILHIGDAMVISQASFVVPLFLATVRPECDGPSRIAWEPPQQVGTRRVAVAESGDAGISFAAPGRQQLGRTVWLPPQPAQGLSCRVKGVKRREVRRRLDTARRQNRDRKVREFEDELGTASEAVEEEARV